MTAEKIHSMRHILGGLARVYPQFSQPSTPPSLSSTLATSPGLSSCYIHPEQLTHIKGTTAGLKSFRVEYASMLSGASVHFHILNKLLQVQKSASQCQP